MHDPELLVLDEPFSGLDPIGADVMAGVLRERADRGVPVVFSSHQLELVERLCDDVAIVRDGRVVAAGTVPELRAERAGRAPPGPRRAGRCAPTAWLSAPGAHPTRAAGSVRLDGGPLDDQVLLDAARAAGRVRRFTAARTRRWPSSSARSYSVSARARSWRRASCASSPA